MERNTLRTFMKARGVSQSQLAREVQVSRQAVSLWLRGESDLSAKHLQRVSRVLGVAMEQLLEPLPCMESKEAKQIRASLLWDKLYPDLDDFAVALLHWEPKAVARLVQTYGLFSSGRMLGKRVWKRFPTYARFIHPGRRRGLEELWRIEKHRTAS